MSFMSLHFGWQRRHNPVRGWTLIELLVVVSVLTVLVALFIPVGRSISAGGLQAKCLNNLRTFGNGIILYAADHQGLPDDRENKNMDVNFVSLLFPHYVSGMRAPGRYGLCCPLATETERQAPNGMEYAGNLNLCRYYPRLNEMPVPASRVVLAAESYYNHFYDFSHFNMAIWGVKSADLANPQAAEGKARKPQYHGQESARGLNFFFLDGHAALVVPPDNNFRNSPTYGDATNGGFFYDVRQFDSMERGKLSAQ